MINWLDSVNKRNIQLRQAMSDNRYEEVCRKLGFPSTRNLTHMQLEELLLELQYEELNNEQTTKPI